MTIAFEAGALDHSALKPPHCNIFFVLHFKEKLPKIKKEVCVHCRFHCIGSGISYKPFYLSTDYSILDVQLIVSWAGALV